MFQRMLSQYEFGSTLFIKSPQIDFCEKKKNSSSTIYYFKHKGGF